ncbi:MAG TPA: D-glycerate dehydrogenase, partial [Acidimicrobiia bacterium]|nr:D-glycerate dehydrogenase [Acidimicrobiia bacterium]
MARPKVFVVQPVMDVGRTALLEIADVVVNESDRTISMPDLLVGVEGADYIWMLGDTPIDDEVMAAAPALKGIATM